jgi:hypothetical protein
MAAGGELSEAGGHCQARHRAGGRAGAAADGATGKCPNFRAAAKIELAARAGSRTASLWVGGA